MKSYKNLLTKSLSKNSWGRWIHGLMMCFILSSCQGALGPGNERELATAAEPSCGFVQNAFGQRISWHKLLPVLFYFDQSISQEYEDGIREAADVWAQAAGRPMARFQRFTGSVPNAKDYKNVIFLDPNWSDKNKNQQAVTNVYWKGKEIIEADIRINVRHFKYFFDNSSKAYSVHFVSLMIHELGHAFGLAHFNQIPTVMWPVLDFGVIRNKPSTQDQGNLQCEYQTK